MPRGSPITIAAGTFPTGAVPGARPRKDKKGAAQCGKQGRLPDLKGGHSWILAEPKTFQQMADELGIRHKLMYTLREASRVTGVPYDTLRIECKAGRLRSQLPEGRQGGAHGAP